MNTRVILPGMVALSMFLSAGCSGLKSGGGGGETLGQQVARHEQMLQRISSQVGNVEQVLPGQAEMWAQMQTMRQDVNAIQGTLDNMQHQGGDAGSLAQLRDRVDRQEALLRQLASQLAVSTSSLDAPPTPDNTGTSGANVGAASGEGAVDTATALYQSGIKSFDQGKYKDAVVSFKDFSSAYPKHALASNAHFWEGESYFQMKDYARAALAYQEVIEKFPGSSKMQASMLKQGIALHNIGKKAAARERLNELVKRYASSPEASRAKQFLATNK